MYLGLGIGEAVQHKDRRGVVAVMGCVFLIVTHTSHEPYRESVEAACRLPTGFRRPPCNHSGAEEHE
jgi:hypothetical protein